MVLPPKGLEGAKDLTLPYVGFHFSGQFHYPRLGYQKV